MLNFEEQYCHPSWQKKKYEIYERDGWQCKCCGNDFMQSASQLHAHHLYYDRSLHLWEYDNESLVTLCEVCHKKVHDLGLKKISGIIAFEILTGKIDATDFLKRIKIK